MAHEIRAGLLVDDLRLDRIPYHDPRNTNWLVRERIEDARAAGVKRRSPTFRPATPTLNQGRLGACVGYFIATALNASPVRRRPAWGDDEARWLYFSAQQEDQWAGGEYPGAQPRMAGTSIIAALRIARRVGIVNEYRWLGAGSGRLADDVVDTLETFGGFGAGIPWYASMFTPDPWGVLEVDPASGLSGYHAIYILDFRDAPLPGRGSRKVPHVVAQNTWGDGWGAAWYSQGGCCYIPLDAFVDVLLAEETTGEAVWLDHPEVGPGS